MGDDNDRFPVGTDIAQHRKELVRFLGSQNSGGLIQDQNVSTSLENLYDLYSLLLRNRHIINLLVGINIEAVSITDLTDLFGRSL